MMIPTKKQILVILTILLVLCWFIYGNHSSEPSYQGRRLTEWLKDASRPDLSGNSVAQDKARWDAAHDAVVAIGTNGIPTLLKMLTYKDSRIKSGALLLLDSQSLIRVNIPRDSDRHLLAQIGFIFLGTNAEPAFADLVHMTQSSDIEQAAAATELLEVFLPFGNPPPLPLLIRTLNDPRPDVRKEVAKKLISQYPEEAVKLNLTNSLSVK